MSDTTRTIKISISGGITESRALDLVGKVIRAGRTSGSPAGPSYCAASIFRVGREEVSVIAHRTRTMDVFRVEGGVS